jgi:hypothetical protein
MVAIATDYWTAVSEAIPAWGKVKDGELKAMDLRQGSISSHSVVLRAIGGIGGEIMKAHPENWRCKLLDLSTVNWNKSNHDWENICIIAGSVVSNRQARLATKAYLKKHMGLPLTDPERRCLPSVDGDAEAPKHIIEIGATRNGEMRYVVFGQEHVADSVRDALVHILEELHKVTPGCLERIRGGRVRPHVARTKEGLFPGSPHLAENNNNSRKLSFGWYVDVNNSKDTVKIIIKKACQAANVEFGKDVLLQF